jgi:membrane associated rhomboid family serine protease
MHQNFYPSFTGVVKNLVLLNIAMFVGTFVILGDSGRMMFAAYMPGSEQFQPWQMITHMFMHGNIMHLAFNMIGIYFFGSMVEMIWNPQRFLLYYFLCGIGAWALHLGVQWWEYTQLGLDPLESPPMLGASGAVFGIMVAFAYHFPNQEIRLMFPPIAMRAKYFVPIMAVLELIYGTQRISNGIAHFAHLGGALVGFLIVLYWSRGRI